MGNQPPFAVHLTEVEGMEVGWISLTEWPVPTVRGVEKVCLKFSRKQSVGSEIAPLTADNMLVLLFKLSQVRAICRRYVPSWSTTMTTPDGCKWSRWVMTMVAKYSIQRNK